MTKPFDGKRATGCVTYLRTGSELVIGGDAIKQKWTDATPLLIVNIRWDHESSARDYQLQDSRGTKRWVAEKDLAVADE